MKMRPCLRGDEIFISGCYATDTRDFPVVPGAPVACKYIVRLSSLMGWDGCEHVGASSPACRERARSMLIPFVRFGMTVIAFSYCAHHTGITETCIQYVQKQQNIK